MKRTFITTIALVLIFGWFHSTRADEKIQYNPPQPEEAPEKIREAVLLGYNIVTNTQKYAKEYVGNELNCHNCHFNGGITQGGKNGSISYVGVAANYPHYRSRQDYSVDLMTRVNNCFMRSLYGKPLPCDSKEMTAIITYFQWISKGIPIYADIPWLGLTIIETGYDGDKQKGMRLFAKNCARCHGENGQGGKGNGHDQSGPPLWGDGSFSDGAGMSKLKTLASFAYYNMPRHNPTLEKTEAMDTAAYVTSQPRPHYFNNK